MAIIIGILFLVFHSTYGDEPFVRIINGTDTKLGEFPYMATLRRFDEDFYCGGVLVSNRHVLTVAYCAARYSTADITVLLGTNDLLNGGEFYDVLQKVVSNDYSLDYSTEIQTDGIAILTLSRKVQFTNNVMKVDLPTGNVSDGVAATFTGYGYQVKDPENGFMSQILKKLPVTVVNQDVCINQLQEHTTIQFQHLCGYTALNRGACYGDSGSPLVYNNTLIGLAQSVHPTCAEGFPDVYMRITYYLEFIRQTVFQ